MRLATQRRLQKAAAELAITLDNHASNAKRCRPVPHFALIDFETTGLSPNQGDRPTELAVLIIRDGEVTQRFVSLMNPGRLIPWDVQRLTGITQAMVTQAPTVASVMAHAASLIGTLPILAHNAAFDRRF